jgi:O-antigen/teichoic acid export membrane protein
MSRTWRVIASASMGYAQMALTTLLNLWWTPFLLRHFRQYDYGLWMAGLPMLTYLNMVDFGVITLLQRDVAFALGAAGGDARRADELPTLVGKTLRLVLIQMPVLCLAAVAVWRLMPGSWEAMRTPFAIVVATLVLSFPLRIAHAVLMGLQDLVFVAKMGMVNWVIYIGGGAILVIAGWGLYGLAAAWAGAAAVTNIAYFVRVRTRFAHTLPRHLPPFARNDAEVRLGKGFWIVLSQLAVILLNGSDVLVIAAVLGPSSVVPYAITGKLIALLANVPQHILASAQPALSELRSSPQRGRLADICTALTQLVFLVSGFVASLVLAVDRAFVGWWVGPQQFAGNKVVVLLVASMILTQWWVAMIYTIFAFGYERRISITTITSGIVTVAATFTLTRTFGIAGAPIASLLGLVVVALPATLAPVAHETGRSIAALVRSLLPWTWRFLLFATAIGFVGKLWTPRTVATLTATSVAVALSYCIVMLPLAFHEPLGTYARPRIAALRARLLGGRA